MEHLLCAEYHLGLWGFSGKKGEERAPSFVKLNNDKHALWFQTASTVKKI